MGSKWNGKIKKQSDDGKVLEQWFFSSQNGSLFISGYRKSNQQKDGSLVVTARCFPMSHHKEPQNAIDINDVPLPPDVLAKVFEETGSYEVRRKI